jgi:membrane-associated HD superfamily phosphohydrolase
LVFHILLGHDQLYYSLHLRSWPRRSAKIFKYIIIVWKNNNTMLRTWQNVKHCQPNKACWRYSEVVAMIVWLLDLHLFSYNYYTFKYLCRPSWPWSYGCWIYIYFHTIIIHSNLFADHRSHDRMAVGFTSIFIQLLYMIMATIFGKDIWMYKNCMKIEVNLTAIRSWPRWSAKRFKCIIIVWK